MKRLFTSNYARWGTDPRAVSISVKPPRWFAKMAHYAPLAPTWELVRQYKLDSDVEAYTKVFMQQLIALNPQDVVDALPADSILLCYEKPSDFCHRHLVREWLNQSGLAAVTELPTKKELEALSHLGDQFIMD